MLLKSYFLSVLVLLSWRDSSQLKLNQCEASLGMQSMEIKDESLSSSSSLNETALSPASARIRLEIGGGAWCPKNHVTSDGEEFLQVDLSELHIITMVETQGRFGNGQGQEFTERYRLEFQRERSGKWFRYRNIFGEEILKGNVNTYIAEMREVRPVIIASKVRFIPYSDHPTKVCLRVELYGCLWREGVVSYSIPQGEKRGSELDFSDFMYDGATVNVRGAQWLVGGLGQLMDRIEGQDNFRLDLNKIGRRGHEWVGWKNDSFPQGNVEMKFAFDSLRNFSSLSIFCNNMFTRDVRCFSRAQVIFSESEFPESDPTKLSASGKSLTTLEFISPRTEDLEMAKNVTIPLRNHVGRHVKVVLFFSSKWILISEVYFSSVPATILPPPLPPYFDHEESSLQTVAPGSKGDDHLQQPTQSNIASDSRLLPTTSPNNSLNWNINKADRDGNDKTGAGERFKTNGAFYEMSSDQKTEFDMMVILLSIFGLLLAIFVVFFLLCMFKGRKYCCHSSDRCFLGHNHHHRHHPSKAPSILMSATGPTNSFFLPLSKSDTSSATFRQSYSFPAAVNGEDQNSGSTVVDPLVFSPFNVSPSAAEEAMYRPPSSAVSFPLTFLDSLPVCGRNRTSNCSNGGFSTSTQPLLPPVYSASSTGFHYTTISGSSTGPPTSLAGSSSSGVTQQTSIPSEVNRDCLKYVATIGDGKFGQVYLCEMQPCSSFSHYSTLSSISSWKAHVNPALVAVKVLLAHTDQTSRAKFENELHIMSSVRDQNIANLVGVCTRDLPNCLVFEYLRYGDLKKFLQKRCSLQQLLSRSASTPSPTAHRSHSSQEIATGNKSESLSTGSLLYMSSQVASGMRHLESLGLVHRDLACRNCLVGDNFHVKVSDLGTSHLSYEADYFSLPSSDLLLPIRWMAWEAVLLGKHTTKSDVWSFGMTFWEMMNFAHKSPFSDFTEEQVLQNCENFRFKNGSETLPPKPHGCSRELYDIMLHCWSREKDDRPTFHEITMFLQQKTSGFNPQDDRHWLDDDNLISE